MVMDSRFDRIEASGHRCNFSRGLSARHNKQTTVRTADTCSKRSHLIGLCTLCRKTGRMPPIANLQTLGADCADINAVVRTLTFNTSPIILIIAAGLGGHHPYSSCRGEPMERVITGASRGIGRAIAINLAKTYSAQCVLVYRSQTQAVEETVEAVLVPVAPHIYFKWTCPMQLQHNVQSKHVSKPSGRIDVLVKQCRNHCRWIIASNV